MPFAPAGATDIVARLMGQWLSERLGQPFVIENRPGAGTNIGTEAVVRAPADGYTLLLVSSDSAINATLYEKLNFNFIRDIAPVAGIIRCPTLCWLIHRFRPRRFPSSSPTPRPTRQDQHGVVRHRNRAAHWQASCSRRWPASTLVHVPYRGGAPHLPI